MEGLKTLSSNSGRRFDLRFPRENCEIGGPGELVGMRGEFYTDNFYSLFKCLYIFPKQ